MKISVQADVNTDGFIWVVSDGNTIIAKGYDLNNKVARMQADDAARAYVLNRMTPED